MRGVSLSEIQTNAAYAKKASVLLTTGAQKIDANNIGENAHLQYHSVIDATSSNIPISSGWSNGMLNLGLHDSSKSFAQIFVAYNLGFYVRPSQNLGWEEMITSKNIDSYIKKYLDSQA